jgi:hypothetical protein
VTCRLMNGCKCLFNVLGIHCNNEHCDSAVWSRSQLARVAEWRAALWRICHGGPGSVAAAPPALDLEALAFVALRLQRALAALNGQLRESVFDPQGGFCVCSVMTVWLFQLRAASAQLGPRPPRCICDRPPNKGSQLRTHANMASESVDLGPLGIYIAFAAGRPGPACAGVTACDPGIGSRTAAAAADVACRWPPAAARHPGAVPAAATSACCRIVLGVSRHISVASAMLIFPGTGTFACLQLFSSFCCQYLPELTALC